MQINKRVAKYVLPGLMVGVLLLSGSIVVVQHIRSNRAPELHSTPLVSPPKDSSGKEPSRAPEEAGSGEVQPEMDALATSLDSGPDQLAAPSAEDVLSADEGSELVAAPAVQDTNEDTTLQAASQTEEKSSEGGQDNQPGVLENDQTVVSVDAKDEVERAQTTASPESNAPDSAEVKMSVTTPAPTFAGTVDDFSALRTDLERMKLEVAIAEQRQKLLEIRSGKVNSAGIPAPSLFPGQVTPAASVPVRKSAPAKPKVISIQGKAGNLRATVKQPGAGLLDVAVGDRVGRGEVVEISPAGVVVSYGGRKTVLGFQE